MFSLPGVKQPPDRCRSINSTSGTVAMMMTMTRKRRRMRRMRKGSTTTTMVMTMMLRTLSSFLWRFRELPFLSFDGISDAFAFVIGRGGRNPVCHYHNRDPFYRSTGAPSPSRRLSFLSTKCPTSVQENSEIEL